MDFCCSDYSLRLLHIRSTICVPGEIAWWR